ncbi:MAG: small ribosomal subunit Rsm22 family protein [Desulfovibrionaceae bacterium]
MKPFHSTIFSESCAEHSAIMEDFFSHLQKILPLKNKHLVELPYAIADLSKILTSARDDISAYWANSRFMAAYFYYFLPWNLIRLSHILPTLQIPSVNEFKNNPVIVDVGSGSLTLPIALWLFRKDLQDIALTVYCCDTIIKPMELGRKLLYSLMDTTQKKTWSIKLLDSKKKSALKELTSQSSLTIASHVYNEIIQKKPKTREHIISSFSHSLIQTLSANGQFLIIEPGTRLGGGIISSIQEYLVENTHMSILAPCTHNEICPYVNSSTWCHFTFAHYTTPKWLKFLTEKAKIHKISLSISFIHAQKQPYSSPFDARIVSKPIIIDSFKEKVRYACSKQGIVIVQNAYTITQGSAICIHIPEHPTLDKKTKFPLVFIAQKQKSL